MDAKIAAEKIAGLYIGTVDGRKVTPMYKTKGLAIRGASKWAEKNLGE